MKKTQYVLLTSVFLLLTLVCATAVYAAQSLQAKREIETLIAGLGKSGCQFERNGSWYTAVKAQAHLQKKYDYLRKRDLADSAELFIERAASRSSISGKPYRVRCPGKPPQAAAEWFATRLRELRGRPSITT